MICLLLSLNGWAKEGQSDPSCKGGVTQYLKDRLELLKNIDYSKGKQVLAAGKNAAIALDQITLKPVRVKAMDIAKAGKRYGKAVRRSSGKILLRSGKNLGKNTALWLPRQQRRYWSRVLEYDKEKKAFAHCKKEASLAMVRSCLGNALKGMALLKREHPDDIHWKGYLLDPVGWAEAPMALPIELLQNKYHLSAPSRIVLGMPAFIGAMIIFDEWLDGRIRQVAEADTIPGIEYLRDLARFDLVRAGTLKEQAGVDSSMQVVFLASAHFKNLENWEKSHGDPKYLVRLKEFKDLGLVESDADLAELNRLAFETYQAEKKKNKDKFATRLSEAWEEKLSKHPKFSKLPPDLQGIIQAIFTPQVEISGHSDLELQARIFGLKVKNGPASDPLRALKPVSEGILSASDLWMAAQSLEHPEIAAQKQERFTKLFPKEDYPFLHRVNFPIFGGDGSVRFDQNGTGIDPYPFKDELSLWELAWKDLRFADIKAAYQEAYKIGDVSDLAGLDLIFKRIAAYNDIYASSRAKTKPDVAKFCAWLGNSKDEPPNELINGNVSYYVGLMQEKRKLSPEQTVGCNIDVAEYMYDFFIHELKSKQGTAKPMTVKEFEDGINRVLSFCPMQSPPRSCP